MNICDTKILNRWTPYHFKNGMISKNRVVVPPMASGTADSNGSVTESTLNHYRKLSESGAGIIFVEYTFIHESGRSEINQLGINSDDKIKGHKELANLIKSSGSIAGIQLVHGGGRADIDLTSGVLMGPSSIIVPTKESDLKKPIEMSLEQIENYQKWYLEAALRASKSGYDIIELHSAHGYGLNQWLSPLTNQRTDDYGGELICRSKMLFEIFKKIRVQLPEKILGVRIPGEDHFEGGLKSNDMIFVSKKLQELGADFIDVSSGIGGWRRPKNRIGEGYLIPDAAAIQAQIAIPVIGVGGIESGSFIDELVAEQKIAFSAVGRKILSDPKKFYEEVLCR